jgi:hypothetical protein
VARQDYRNWRQRKERNFNENIAMTSDIFTASVMLSFIIHRAG